jgi:hypothetical protein
MKKITKALGLTILLSSSFMFSYAQELKCGTYSNFDSKFYNIGALHNAHLSNVFSNYTTNETGMSYESAVKSIADFNSSFSIANQYQYTGIPVNSKEINGNFNSYKYMVNEAEFRKQLLAGEGVFSLDACISKVNAMNITPENKQMLSDIAGLLKGNAYGEVSDLSFENALVQLANSWLDKNGVAPTSGSEITGCVLAIGLKSCEWWKEHPDAKIAANKIRSEIMESGPSFDYTRHEDLLVAWPLLDVAGGLVGAVLNTANQLLNNGGVNGGQLAISSGASAVSASVGLVGKVARWIKSLF